MIFVCCAMIAGFGLMSVLMRKTLLGVVLGLQLLGLACSLVFVVAGVQAEVPLAGGVFGWLISISYVAVYVAAFALIARFFILKQSAAVENAGELKR